MIAGALFSNGIGDEAKKANHENGHQVPFDPVKVAATSLQFKLPFKGGDYG
jgi:hypothetical protein